MSGTKLRINQRLRNTIMFDVTDDELRAIHEAVEASEHQNRSEWLRAACEAYTGQELFRKRRESTSRSVKEHD